MKLPLRALLLSGGLTLAGAFHLEAQTRHSDEWLIASAVLAAPEQFRAQAEIRKRGDGGGLTTIREGSVVICLADDPAVEGFRVACYHESLEPFMQRGRELSAQGVEAEARMSARWEEARSGRLAMPETVAMVFNLAFPTDDFDPATIDPATGDRLHAAYLPGMTPESTGLPTQPAPGAPWLMYPGQPSSHVMIALPKADGGADRSPT